jgi:hypothetical protein
VSETVAKLGRALHPPRLQRWEVSDYYNPWCCWLRPIADAVKAQRTAGAPDESAGAVGDDEPARRIERMMSEATSAALDYYRDVRDAMSGAAFFLTYGCLFSLYLADERAAEERRSAAAAPGDPRDLPFVKDALASIEEGGYAESPHSHRRVINRDGERIPLARLELRRDLAQDYAEFLPAMSRTEMRRIRGEQDIIVRYEPERGLGTLPKLLAARPTGPGCSAWSNACSVTCGCRRARSLTRTSPGSPPSWPCSGRRPSHRR